MTICPIAVVAGCAKCPLVKACPLKTVIGNYTAKDASPDKTPDTG